MERGNYLLRKLGFAAATLAAVLVFNFLLFRILPGDPVKLIIHSPRMTREAQERIRSSFGLDKPLWLDVERLKEGDVVGALDSQFTTYLGNLFRGELGISFASRQDVAQMLSERVWRTVVLVLAGDVIAIFLGMALGMVAAWRRGTRLDAGILLGALFSWALPTFFLGIILLILARGRLPVGGMVTPGLRPEDGLTYWLDVGRHLVLPTITMAIVYTGEYVLIMRSGVMEVLAEDYILTAKAKGLSTLRILRTHALKNAMLPMVTMIALTFGYTVGGAIQVETVFSWPGIGRLMYEAVQKRDYPVLQGTFLLLAVSVIVANLVADLLYSALDPRVKAE
ncbi:MAG: ABC transporter permease [Anaerolineaceae bacterium]|jgi:peptide/nickel transport system permease protein|nr:ABC transporter permease [Anaerolineae bacterium]MDX9830562.1 ABC transporter permease [Anaerolineae bacterium]NLF11881.1 ABC transporter permease [Anaerolineaceae bacterium]